MFNGFNANVYHIIWRWYIFDLVRLSFNKNNNFHKLFEQIVVKIKCNARCLLIVCESSVIFPESR